ncbi:sugar ABC transporter permease [Neomoorella humiferrea]|uniref:carbohydrate ABC transporter permease n=1 Tax=Neomoorella humiferrea TaxID=676965 RepID=UPI003D8A468E
MEFLGGRQASSEACPSPVKRGKYQLLSFHYLAILPALVTTIVIIVIPLLYSLILSLYRYILTDPYNIRFIALGNYYQAFHNPSFINSIKVTFIYAFVALGVEFILGMAAAVMVNNVIRGQGLVRTAMLVPMFMTPAVAALIWRFMLHPDLGIVNYFTRLLGCGTPVWLGNPTLALISVVFIDIWRNTPFMFLVFLAGMQSLPSELYEAAAVDGASSRQMFWRVTLPLLKPLILVALIIRGMDIFREFDTIFVATGGGPGYATETISLATYRYSFRNYDIGVASAVSYIIFVIVFLLSLVFVNKMQQIQNE